MSIGLPLLVVALYLAGMTGSVLLIIAAFRVSKGWGFSVMCIPFVSFIFRLRHPEEVGPSFRVSRICYVICFALVGTNPQTFGTPGNRLAAITTALHLRSPERTTQTTHAEAAERADENEEAAAATDAQPAVATTTLEYREHVAELNATYEQLKAERAALKGAGPAMTAFNAKAARYQADLSKMAEEKARLDGPAGIPTNNPSETGAYTRALAQSISNPVVATKTTRR